jgi:hypothetical protein
MVNPRIYLAEANLKITDVIQRFGLQYVSQFNQGMIPFQKRALSDITACCTRELRDRLYYCEDCDNTLWRYH